MPVSLEVANRTLQAMSHMNYFPDDPEAIAILAGLIADGCPNEAAALRLPGVMLFDNWPGSATLMHKIRELRGPDSECPLCRGHRFRVVLGDGRIVPPGSVMRIADVAKSQPCDCVRCQDCSDSGFVLDRERGGVKSCICRRVAAAASSVQPEQDRSTARARARSEREEKHS